MNAATNTIVTTRMTGSDAPDVIGAEQSRKRGYGTV
jgi:hypothetical protein